MALRLGFTILLVPMLVELVRPGDLFLGPPEDGSELHSAGQPGRDGVHSGRSQQDLGKDFEVFLKSGTTTKGRFTEHQQN